MGLDPAVKFEEPLFYHMVIIPTARRAGNHTPRCIVGDTRRVLLVVFVSDHDGRPDP